MCTKSAPAQLPVVISQRGTNLSKSSSKVSCKQLRDINETISLLGPWSFKLVSVIDPGIWVAVDWRKLQPTPVLLPGESHGRRSLVGYSSWSRKESDMTERLHFSLSFTHLRRYFSIEPVPGMFRSQNLLADFFQAIVRRFSSWLTSLEYIYIHSVNIYIHTHTHRIYMVNIYNVNICTWIYVARVYICIYANICITCMHIYV